MCIGEKHKILNFKKMKKPQLSSSLETWNYNHATVLLPTTTTRNQQTTTMAKYVQYHVSPLDKRRHWEKRRKRRRKAQECANTKLAPKNNRSAPAQKITMNKNENKQAVAFLQKHSKSCFYKPFLNQNLRQQHKAIQPKASNHRENLVEKTSKHSLKNRWFEEICNRTFALLPEHLPFYNKEHGRPCDGECCKKEEETNLRKTSIVEGNEQKCIESGSMFFVSYVSTSFCFLETTFCIQYKCNVVLICYESMSKQSY